MKKFFYVLLAFSLFVLGCGKEAKESANGKTVVVSIGAKPKSLDPQLYNSIPDLSVSRQFYNSLLTKESDGSIVPELAESYEYKSDKELFVTLKKGIKFHNGAELKADDVVFSFNRMKEKAGASVMLSELDKVEKVDNYSVKFTLKKPSSPFLFNLAHPLTSIMNKEYTMAHENEITTSPMGTGAYKLISYGSGEKIETVSNPDYFKGQPKVDGVIFRVITENSSRLIALETGEADVIYGVAPIDAKTVEDNKKLTLLSKPTTGTEYITCNVQKAPFDNKDFRMALNYVIDKQSVIDTIFLGKAKIAKSIVSPNVFGFYDGLTAFEFNPEKAKELIKKSGVKNTSFTIYVNDNPVRLQVAQIIQANLKEIGVDMKIETLEWGTYLQKTADGDFQAYLGGWICGTGDADIVLYPLLNSKSIGGAGNRAHYSNAEFDKEVEMARSVVDVDARKEHYKNAQLIIEKDAPLIVLYNKNESIGFNKRVKGFKYDPTLVHKLETLEISE